MFLTGVQRPFLKRTAYACVDQFANPIAQHDDDSGRWEQALSLSTGVAPVTFPAFPDRHDRQRLSGN